MRLRNMGHFFEGDGRSTQIRNQQPSLTGREMTGVRYRGDGRIHNQPSYGRKIRGEVTNFSI